MVRAGHVGKLPCLFLGVPTLNSGVGPWSQVAFHFSVQCQPLLLMLFESRRCLSVLKWPCVACPGPCSPPSLSLWYGLSNALLTC